MNSLPNKEQQAETQMMRETLTSQAISKGYSQTEAEMMANKVVKAVMQSRTTGDGSYYAKAYKQFLSRLV